MCYPREFRDINEARRRVTIATLCLSVCDSCVKFASFLKLQLRDRYEHFMTHVFCSFTDPITTNTPPENNPPVSPYARLRDALATHPRTLRRPLTQEAADN
ncbi:hypothetical protein Avbf_17791 [Armadillidium vulgare]|nr:hypothetical protein Avbf_17537 [Armadillidium vulgare]RXG61479.1 hypothetical protein Avbf_17791 [Armadillidium vulgare]